MQLTPVAFLKLVAAPSGPSPFFVMTGGLKVRGNMLLAMRLHVLGIPSRPASPPTALVDRTGAGTSPGLEARTNHPRARGWWYRRRAGPGEP